MNKIYFEDFFVNVAGRIIDDSFEHGWECFKDIGGRSICRGTEFGYSDIVYTPSDGVVLVADTSDYKNGRAYRYVDSEFLETWNTFLETSGHLEDAESDIDEVKYETIESATDYLTKARSIIAGEDYDTRMLVEDIQLTDEQFLTLAKMAHEQDVTFNDLVSQLLNEKLSEMKEELTKEPKYKAGKTEYTWNFDLQQPSMERWNHIGGFMWGPTFGTNNE